MLYEFESRPGYYVLDLSARSQRAAGTASGPQTMYAYFDESIHDAHGFILGAFVLTERPLDDAVAAALVANGFRPGEDEYKSGTRVAQNRQLVALRQAIAQTLDLSAIGLVIVGRDQRADLGKHALLGLARFRRRNALTAPIEVFFDQGVFSSVRSARRAAMGLGALGDCHFHFEQDSRRVGGLQAADLVAHYASHMLIEALTGRPRMIRLGEESGYEEGTEVSLGWSHRYSLRYNFLKGDEVRVRRRGGLVFADLFHHCIYASLGLRPEIAAAVGGTFDTIYMGCIH